MNRDEIKRFLTQGNQYDNVYTEGKLGRLSGKKSVYKGCDLSGFDPEFLNFLSFFETKSANRRRLPDEEIKYDPNKRIDDRSMMNKIADFFSSDPNIINSVFIDEMNKKALPMLNLILGAPAGLNVICDEIVKLSQVFSAAKRKAMGEMNIDPKYAANAARDSRRELSIDGDEIKNASNYMSTIVSDTQVVNRTFPYTDATQPLTPVANKLLFPLMTQGYLRVLKSNTSSTTKEFDLILANALIPNTLKQRMQRSQQNDNGEFADIDTLKNEVDNIETQSFSNLFSKLDNLSGTINSSPDSTQFAPTRSGNTVISDINVKKVRYELIITWCDQNKSDIESYFKTTNNFIVYFIRVLDNIKNVKS